MKFRNLLITILFSTIISSASAQITEATATTYVNKVKMTQAKQDQLTQQALGIINNNYATILTKWNSVAANQFSGPSLKYQFQGSIGYKMALSQPPEAKSDVDVAFLYLYSNGRNQPKSLNAAELKTMAKDVFRDRYQASYTYDIKDPVVVLTQGTGTAADHFDIAFFGELTAQGTAPPPAECVNTAARNFPCSELNWGRPAAANSSWDPNDRLNLIETLNLLFDRPQDTIVIHEAGMIFKEWRHKIYKTLDTDVVDPEKPPSIALVTLLYNALKAKPSTNYNNAFVLLQETTQSAATNNFKNNCAQNPAAFEIKALTYPNSNLLSKLSTAQKQEFCTKLMDFRDALIYANTPGRPPADAIKKLQDYLPIFP